MELSGKRRWAALGDWTSWSDGGYLVQIAKPASRAVGRAEPDLHLIKQVKQVTISALTRTGVALRQDSEHGVTDA
jgi:hypothetical protein